MRNLKTTDLFAAMRIINAAGIGDEVKKMALRVQNGEKLNVNEVGTDFIFNCIAACGDAKVEKMLYGFLGGLLEVDAEEIANKEPLELFEEVKKLGEVIDKKAWLDFFQLLARSVAKQS